MKADLVSLFTRAYLNETGHLDDAVYRSAQASGVLRTLQPNQPRRDQPYQTMQLMQMNYFLEHDLLSFKPSSDRLAERIRESARYQYRMVKYEYLGSE